MYSYLFIFRLAVLLKLLFASTALSMASEQPSFKGNVGWIEADPIPREVLFGNPERTQGRFSPDGAVMSFLKPVDGVLNVWTAPSGELEEATPRTQDQGRGILGHAWARNGIHLLYIQDTGGDENFRIYAVDTRTGEERNLTPFENVRANFIASSWKYPDNYLVGLNNRDPRWHDVWNINVVTGERELIAENPGFRNYYADRELNLRLAVRPQPDGSNLVLKQDPNGEWIEFMTIPREDALTTSPVGFLEGGEQFYMIDSRNRNTAGLFLVDFETGEQELIAESEKADISSVLTDPETGKVLAYSINYLKESWHVLDASVEKDLNTLESRFPDGFSVIDQTRDNQTWMLAIDSSTKPLTYYVFRRGDQSIEVAFETRPDLQSYKLAKMHATVIQSRDDLPLVSYLTLPPGTDPDGDGRPSNPLPMVLDVHGGPWARDSYGFSSSTQWLANRGYAVLNVNFRGSSGFGKDFLNAGDLEWGRKMHDDLIDAVHWAVGEGIAQEDKVAIYGGSYGGYAALTGVTMTPGVFACGVSIVGPSNLKTLLDSVPPYWASFFEQLATRVGDPRTEEGLQLLEERSPLTYVDNIQDPLLIGQGANDPRVKQAESDQIVEAMEAKEIPVVYVLFPDEGHGFARPENRLAFNAVTEIFLSENLGGRYEAIGEALTRSSTTVPAGSALIPGLDQVLDGFEPTIAK